MTEAEWLACDEPWPLLDLISEKASGRKMGLFACACFRRCWLNLKNPGLEQKAVEMTELFVDGLVDRRELQGIHRQLVEAPSTTQLAYSSIAAELTARLRSGFDCRRVSEIASMLETKEVALLGVSLLSPQYPESAKPVRYQQSLLVREIFGNPFHPVRAKPSWRTSTAVAIAQGIYDELAFDRMPILADALQDAGCESEDILGHCRGSGPHVRGCWVVDLVLGKE